jgi:hypothetical protein
MGPRKLWARLVAWNEGLKERMMRRTMARVQASLRRLDPHAQVLTMREGPLMCIRIKVDPLLLQGDTPTHASVRKLLESLERLGITRA